MMSLSTRIITSYVGTILLGAYEFTVNCKLFKEVLSCYSPPPIITTTIDGERVGFQCALGEVSSTYVVSHTIECSPPL